MDDEDDELKDEVALLPQPPAAPPPAATSAKMRKGALPVITPRSVKNAPSQPIRSTTPSTRASSATGNNSRPDSQASAPSRGGTPMPDTSRPNSSKRQVLSFDRT